MFSHPLIKSLVNLRGNPRACVYTEPIFGIPSVLFAPYASVYMLALGLVDQQIGLISSLGLVIQIFTSLVGGAITDKFGRRLTLLVADFVSWSVPCLIWAVAQDFRYFLLAAIFNSVWRISHTAWTCLMVEDAEPGDVIHIWTWIFIIFQGLGLLAPIAGLLVERFSLVPAMRGLYFFSFVMMTIKLILLFFNSTETQRGVIRRQETRHQSIFSMLGEYRGVFRQLLRTRLTLVVMGMMILLSIFQVVNSAFWAVLVTEKLRIPSEDIAIYPFIRSIVILFSFFVITPRLTTLHFKRPLAWGFMGMVVTQLLLVFMPERNYLLLGVATLVEALSFALIGPMVESLLVATVDAAERARISALIYMTILIFTSPFGWIAGQLSALDRSFPFILNAALFVVGALLVWLAGRLPFPAGSEPVKE